MNESTPFDFEISTWVQKPKAMRHVSASMFDNLSSHLQTPCCTNDIQPGGLTVLWMPLETQTLSVRMQYEIYSAKIQKQNIIHKHMLM